MAVATETVAVRYEDVQAGVPISVPYPVYEVLDVRVYYGSASLLAVYNTDYTVSLADDFDTFTLTPTASLIAKINDLIAADPTEENYITVRRQLDYLTDATAAAVRYTPFTAREFERTVLRLQQLQEQVDRCLALAPRFVGGSVPLRIDELTPDGVLAVNGAGTAISMGPSIGDIGEAGENAATAVEAAATAVAAAAAALGAANAGYKFATLALAMATPIAAPVAFVDVLSYDGVRGGGGTYERVVSEPAHGGKFQDALGAWWELKLPDDRTVCPTQFGAMPGHDLSGQEAAFQRAIEYLKAKGGGRLDVSGNWAIKHGVAITDATDIELTSSFGRIKYLQTDFGYYHLFRINNCTSVRVNSLSIYSDATLERGDTGFAIQISGSYNIRVEANTFTDIASACVWIDNSQDLHVNGNTINSGKADGIHFADGCVDFVASANIINAVEDDAIAVVRDIGAGIPNAGVIDGNVIRDIIRGHGVVLISCYDVTVSNNNMRGFIGAAIGSYIWSGTGDRAIDLLITGNKISNVANGPENAASASAMLFRGTARLRVLGNDVAGPAAAHDFPEVCHVFLDNYDDVLFKGNVFHDSAKWGILVNPVTGSNPKTLKVEDNTFDNIGWSAVQAVGPAPNCHTDVSIHDNSYRDVAYAHPNGYIIDVANAGASPVYVSGNKQIHQVRLIRIDQATCSNIFAEDNTPSVRLTYNANGRAIGDVAFTASTTTATYWRANGMVYVHILVHIATKGAGNGLLVTLPVGSDDSAGHAFQFREMAAVGMGGTAEFLNATTLYLSPADAAQGQPVADGRAIEINGWYTSYS